MTSDSLIPSEAMCDRRHGDRRHADRRKRDLPVASERRTGADRRRQKDRRQGVNPVTTERHYTEEEVSFMMAMDQYKRAQRKPYPTWAEVLAVAYALGYRKVAQPCLLPGDSMAVAVEL